MVMNISFCTDVVRFYTERWITDEEFIPSNPVDLMVLRTKFEESVRRHLLAEVIISTTWSMESRFFMELLAQVPYGVLLSGGLDSSLVASVCQVD